MPTMPAILPTDAARLAVLLNELSDVIDGDTLLGEARRQAIYAQVALSNALEAAKVRT